MDNNGFPADRPHHAPQSHVVIAYKDDDDDQERNVDQPTSSLLPNRSNVQLAPPPPTRSRSCCKRLILCISILAICIGCFEVAFHGKEAESLQAAKEKIAQLQAQLGQHVKSGYNKVMATINLPSIDQSIQQEQSRSGANNSNHDDGDEVDSRIRAVKSKSVVVLKTGASVLFDRLPVQLLHAQQSIDSQIHLTGQATTYHGPSFLIYSDSDMQMGPFSVHDAFANVSSFVRNDPDFSQRYTQLHALLASEDDLRAKGFNEGWNLDKWKFLYMWQDAFQRHPEADWYIGYEADTYVLWDSLFKFLALQDAGKEQLFGCGSILVRNQELFANGGCPYVMSGALMRATYGKDPDFASKFDSEVKASCCGDAELSIALRKSATIPINNLGEAGARFQGERPREILFDAENWCQPVFSFHHLSADEVQWLSRIEHDIRPTKNRQNGTILYSDIFDHIIPSSLDKALRSLAPDSGGKGVKVELNPTREDWEAFGSNDKGVKQGKRTQDVEECKVQCVDSKGCTTWFWIKVTEQDTDGDCYLMHDAVRIGKSYEGTGLRTSGWIATRIANFKAHHFCKNPPEA